MEVVRMACGCLCCIGCSGYSDVELVLIGMGQLWCYQLLLRM